MPFARLQPDWDGWTFRPGASVWRGGDEFHPTLPRLGMERDAERARMAARAALHAARVWAEIHSGELGYCVICGALTRGLGRVWIDDGSSRGRSAIARSCIDTEGGLAPIGRHVREDRRCELIDALRRGGFQVDADTAVRRINELLTMPEAAWAKASLEGMRETILRTDRVTAGQRRAIENIDRAVARRV